MSAFYKIFKYFFNFFTDIVLTARNCQLIRCKLTEQSPTVQQNSAKVHLLMLAMRFMWLEDPEKLLNGYDFLISVVLCTFTFFQLN